MSLFNLDRFRFDKKKTTPNKQQQQNGSISPESEKENKPARMRSDNSPMKKSDAFQKVFEDSVIVDSDTDVTDDSDTYEVEVTRPDPKAQVTPVKSPKKSHHRGVVYEDVISDTDEEDRPGPEARVIPVKNLMKSHLRRVAREDVITISDNSEDERRDPNAKITIKDKEPASKSSNCDMEQSIEGRVKKVLEIFPERSKEEVLKVVTSTGTLEGAIAAIAIMTPTESKKRHMESSSSQDSDVVPPSKKMRALMESSQDTDEEQEEDDHEAMVERLQKKFPDQEKKELKIVLEQHDWVYEDALETLIMFSDPDDAESKEEKTNKSKEEHKSTRDRSHHKNSKHGKEASANSSSSTLSTWLTKRSDLSPAPSSSSSRNSSRNSSSLSPTKFYSSTLTKTMSKYASATSIAKKEAEERKRKAHASTESSGGEDDSENELLEPVSSEFEDSEDDLDSVGEAETASEKSSPREQIVKFFQEASLDELSLISYCSLKKAKKIVELRPFDSWESLREAFNSEGGLNEDLLLGCKVVLKERQVVQGLMSKCETISSKMIRQVTQVMENGTRGAKQPSILNSQLQLKPYQMIGLKWLLLLNQHNLSGILADEMGLGKTIQAIAFLAQLYQNGEEGPHLIVVPSSTLDNWVREFKLWCPNLEVLIYYGNQEDRRYIRRDILDGAVNFNVIVTTYNLAIGNHSDRTLFMKLRLNYAVFDEGHMLKNMNTLRYRNLMEINAEHRLLLTGTPLQNNLLELMSLLNFIMPSMFSSSTKQFTKMFSQKPHEEQSPFERDRIAQAKSIMKPFILRRVKSEVLKQLPDKEEIIEYCPMSEKQQILYQGLFNKLKKSPTGEKRELCNVFMQLRKMANHPLLHRQYYTTEKLHAMSALMLKEPTHRDANADLIQEDMEVMSDFELHRLCQQYTSISSYQLETHLVLDSGKFDHLTELLASLKDKGDRVVLFSQFTMMLDIVEVLMRHLKHRYIRLDGQTPIADRIGLIDDFNTDLDIFVFLLSTKAGGLGINLTSANVVILHDIDFNPYNDKQAEDRCHRLGQTRTVKVIKLVHKDTIEDSMMRLGRKKLKLEQDMTAAEEGGEGTIPEDMASLLKASLGM